MKNYLTILLVILLTNAAWAQKPELMSQKQPQKTLQKDTTYNDSIQRVNQKSPSKSLHEKRTISSGKSNPNPIRQEPKALLMEKKEE